MADNTDLLFSFTEVLVQTIFYGVFVTIIPLSAHIILKKGLNIRANFIMLAISIGIFILSTVYWAITVTSLYSKVTLANTTKITALRELFNAIVLVNYLFADGVVVWRMRVLCAARFSPKMMVIPAILLVCTALSVTTTISLRIAVTASAGSSVARHGPIATGIDVTQITTLVLSLFTNMTATLMIGIWAWQYRRSIRANIRDSRSTSTQVERILLLLAESGVAYCFSSLFVLLGSFIHVPGGTLGDIYTGIHVQIAGMYPALVMVLVTSQRSSASLAVDHSNTSSHSEHPASSEHPANSGRHHEKPPGQLTVVTVESMQFASNPGGRRAEQTVGSVSLDSVVDISEERDGKSWDRSLGTVSESDDGESKDHVGVCSSMYRL